MLTVADGIGTNKSGILRECSAASPTVANLPFYYQIQLNLPCNQKCIMCAPGGKHRKDRLSLDEFTALFEEIQNVAEHVTLIGGEPLMYPDIDAVLELLASRDIAVTINTNATMLTEKIAGRLLALRELNLRCSIDAVTRETYREIRGTDVFDRVTANLRRFSAAAAGHPRIRMILVYVVMRRNIHEVVPFVDFARSLAVERVEFHPVRHVASWHVDNGTGWSFDGGEQCCEFFRDEYNAVIERAAAKCAAAGLAHEIHPL